MSHKRFEANSAFFHVVTPGEESPNDSLEKIRSMHNGAKQGVHSITNPFMNYL